MNQVNEATTKTNDLPGSVLFMCSQNSVRSPMAAALARVEFPNSIFFDSAGVRAGLKNSFAIEVMSELNIDISGHQPETFADLEDSYFDLIIALSTTARSAAMDINRSQSIEVEFWQIGDPTQTQGRRSIILDAYRAIRNDLSARIVARFGGNRL